MERVIKNLPLHDDCSGMANLRQRERERRLKLIDQVVNAALWIVSAALLLLAGKLFFF